MDWTCLEVTQVGCLVVCHCVTVIGWQIYLYSSVCVCVWGGGGGGGGGFSPNVGGGGTWMCIYLRTWIQIRVGSQLFQCP